ncbi:response regulator transcription factor [Mesorhizobium sp. A556]
MQAVTLFRHALNQWENGKPSGRQQLFALAQELQPRCDESTNLYIIDLLPDDPLQFGSDALVENVDMRGLRSTLGGYADQQYVKRDVVPHFLDAKESGEMSWLRMKSRIQDQIAVYDRLLLPVAEHKSVRWAISITKTRLLLPAMPKARLLTERQEDILFLLSQGSSSKEIARRFGVSHRTVEHQVDAIKKRLGAKNVAHAVAIAVAQAIIE